MDGSILPLTRLLAHGGPVVACAPGVANDLSFLMEFENHAFAAACAPGVANDLSFLMESEKQAFAAA